MVTVPEAARRVGKNPETVRRWIREGKLRSHRVGTQHLIDEADLEAFLEVDEMARLPEHLRYMSDGRPMVNVVRMIRLAREGR